jgi:tRNA modification GTPase
MNCLLGKNRSIVTDIPGTTRDTIEESLVVDGVWIRLVDTAGLRESGCEIEREGIRRATSLLEKADYVLYVVDGSASWSDTDRESIARIGRARCAIIYSKADLGSRSSAEPISGFATASLSLIETGVDTVLRGVLAEYVHGMISAVPHAAISERHRSVLCAVRNDVVEAKGLLEADFEGSCAVAAAQIRQSLEALGILTGRNYSEELLDRIFSRFCVGK